MGSIPPYRENFKEHLSAFGKRLADLPGRQWDDALRASSMVDIVEPLNNVFERHGLTAGQLLVQGQDELTAFMDELPSSVVDMHLHKQVLKNPQFQPKDGDLEDWSAPGMAAVWCDVVVCEKHMAHLLKRDRFNPKATVLRRFENLQEVSA